MKYVEILDKSKYESNIVGNQMGIAKSSGHKSIGKHRNKKLRNVSPLRCIERPLQTRPGPTGFVGNYFDDLL